MNASFYRQTWSKLKENADASHISDLKHLSRQIAYSFLDYYLKDCHYETDYIDLLCEMTTFSSDPDLNSPGAQALFGIIIESLCDDFEDLQTETYNRVITQVISYCRNIASGKALDLSLKRFDMHTQQDLIDRNNMLRNNNTMPIPKNIKKILLLSRVTIGADIAITSVMLQKLAIAFPEAEMVLIGEKKLEEIYSGNDFIKIRYVQYSRKGGLMDRLSSWNHVLDIILDETKTVSAKNTILVDPDSRLSQLGVMPLVPRDNYFFFDSRSVNALNNKMSMVELANKWLDAITGHTLFCYTKVWLQTYHLETATGFLNQIREQGAKKIIVINFGVGGNQRKKIGKLFEETLLLTLLKEPGTVILLDKGFGKEELDYTNALLNTVNKHGHAVSHTRFNAANHKKISHGVIGIECKIGEIAALIAKSDEFIGYDSACQHIAAALNTPCVTIFAGSNNMRFIRRWSAFGRQSCHIVHVDTLTNPSAVDTDGIITRIMHVRQMRNQT